MILSQRKSRLLTPRVLLLGFSLISLVICALGATAHYRKLAWGDPWQPIGWLLSMLFLLCAFLPDPRGLATGFRSLIKPKTAFFLLDLEVTSARISDGAGGIASQYKLPLRVRLYRLDFERQNLEQ